MRKSVFFILLATAAMPVLAAAPGERDGGGGRHAARAESSEGGGGENSQRPQRAARSERANTVQDVAVQRAERSERAPRAEPTQQIVQSSNQSSGRSSNGYTGRHNWTGSRSNDGVQAAPVVTRGSKDSVTNWRARERYSRGATSPTIPTTTRSTSSRYSGDRSGTNWRDRTRDGGTSTGVTRSTSWRDSNRDDHSRRWSTNWRNDHRYNWRTYRTRYSSLYNLGSYYDPFGYGYRRFSIGLRLGSGYYNSNYWLDDPWQYRLPPAYGPYRWIRYYNDALLVDIYSGEVVDVIYGFFW